MTPWISRLAAWRRRSQLEIDLAEEMESHLLLKQDEYRRAGLSESDARFAALRDMGNATLMREDARAVWVTRWLESFLQDVTYGVRGLFRNPAFSLTAILSLGLAIGFNTSYFTVFNAVILRPWPVLQPDRVFTVWSVNPKAPGPRSFGGLGPAEARFLAQSAGNISGLAVHRGGQVQVGEVAGETSPALFVSGNYFGLLGVPFAAGRGFIDQEDLIESPQLVTVISHRLWTERYGSDPDIGGRTVRINGRPFSIVGVTADEFAGTSPGATDYYLPLSSLPSISGDESKWARDFLTLDGYCCANIAVRLANASTRAMAESELDSLHRLFQLRNGRSETNLRLERTAFVSPGQKRKLAPLFGLFFLAVTLVLLLACANAASLTLARAATRTRELGIRLSIGASRGRIVRQLLTESLVVALAGATVGIVLAWWLPGAIFKYGVREPLALQLRPDLAVLAYTLVVAFAASMLSGLAPALHATRSDRFRLFQGTSASNTSRFSLRGAMLAFQVTLSVILLCGAFLLLRATEHAKSLDPGFRIEGVSQGQVQFPVNSLNAERIQSLLDSTDNSWSNRRIAVTNNPPNSFISHSWGVVPPGGHTGANEESIPYVDVSPAYFEVLGIPILEGRNFTPADRGRNVLILNRKLADAYWPSGGAVGRFVKIGESSYQIVGIVRDAMTSTPGEVQSTMYRPFSGTSAFLLWRQEETDGADLQMRVQRFDGRVRLEQMTLTEARDRRLRGTETSLWLTGGLGAFALTLAAIGIFGAFSFAVEQRRREIGIRLSLGARTSAAFRTHVQRQFGHDWTRDRACPRRFPFGATHRSTLWPQPLRPAELRSRGSRHPSCGRDRLLVPRIACLAGGSCRVSAERVTRPPV